MSLTQVPVQNGVYINYNFPQGAAEYYASPQRWKTRFTAHNTNAVNLYLAQGPTIKMRGMVIGPSAAFNLAAQSGPIDLELEDCWCWGAPYDGIVGFGTIGSLKMRHCLVEMMGSHHSLYGHGIYYRGTLDIQQCIFRNNAGYSVQLYPGGSSGTFAWNLVVNPWLGMTCQDDAVQVRRCTIVGEPTGAGGYFLAQLADARNHNLVVDFDASNPSPFVDPTRGLFWLTDKTIKAGCYPYNANLNLGYAKTRWPDGYMSGSLNHPITPFWPGDTPPGLGEIEVVYHREGE